ncbi:hypothetical protein [Geodermatophilus africanus]|nr:hypothetical protein [Geodermatophilus africanus]
MTGTLLRGVIDGAAGPRGPALAGEVHVAGANQAGQGALCLARRVGE